MKEYNLSLRSLFVLTIILFCANIIPGQSKVGITIGQFLKIEPSSRLAGMGNAGAALPGEAAAVFYNPAGLGRMNGAALQFTINKWIADIDYNYLVGVFDLGDPGVISLSITSLSSGEIDVRTVESPDGTGERYTVSNFAAGIGYGVLLTDRVSVGMQISYLTETIWHSSLSTFTLNFGVQYLISDDGALIGASISNFGANAGYEGRDLFIDYDFDPDKFGDNDGLPAEFRTEKYPLPTMFRAGFSYPVKFNDSYKMIIAADAVHPNDNNESVNLGAELNLMNHFSLRAGYRNLFLDNTEGGLTLGAGIGVSIVDSYDIRVDYTWADYGRLIEAHRLTIGLAFK